MKKLIYLVAFLLPLLTSCEDFLDTQSYTTKNSETFPKTEEDAAQMLTGVYAVLNTSLTTETMSTYLMVAELASDDRFGGGGANDKSMQAFGHLLYSDRNQFSEFWTQQYRGISRANAAVTALEAMEEGDTKAQKMGEAKFLRAYFYFDLVQLLGDVPLMKGAPENVQEAKTSPPQATQEEIFTQIGTDLWEAYSTMPSVKWNGIASGTVTKWAAAGLLARVYLFYTGFYQKDALPIEGGQVTSQQVAAALKDCIDNSGHSLLKDFRSLWTYTNSLTKKDYPFAKDADTWVRDGQNSEHVFVVKTTNLVSWDTRHYSNPFSLFFGIRSEGDTRFKDVFPMGQGWGAGPVNSALWDEWKTDAPDDIRRSASIYNQEDEAANDYLWGADQQMEETGMWQKKIVAITAYGKGGDNTALYNSFFSASEYFNSSSDDFQLGHGSDLIRIRFADILLMHSEITKTADGMNAVRARAGLPAVASYSDAALRKERRHELAFEGLRWGDIRRWGIAEDLAKIYGVPIRNNKVQTSMKRQGVGVVERYKATKGFFMIPQREIDLANGALKQNEGWGTDAIFNAWVE
ncbi:membrane protein [Bacteroidia bacterium]|nr:membrane protein [Bacteroidia bacterium]